MSMFNGELDGVIVVCSDDDDEAEMVVEAGKRPSRRCTGGQVEEVKVDKHAVASPWWAADVLWKQEWKSCIVAKSARYDEYFVAKWSTAKTVSLHPEEAVVFSNHLVEKEMYSSLNVLELVRTLYPFRDKSHLSNKSLVAEAAKANEPVREQSKPKTPPQPKKEKKEKKEKRKRKVEEEEEEDEGLRLPRAGDLPRADDWLAYVDSGGALRESCSICRVVQRHAHNAEALFELRWAAEEQEEEEFNPCYRIRLGGYDSLWRFATEREIKDVGGDPRDRGRSPPRKKKKKKKKSSSIKKRSSDTSPTFPRWQRQHASEGERLDFFDAGDCWRTFASNQVSSNELEFGSVFATFRRRLEEKVRVTNQGVVHGHGVVAKIALAVGDCFVDPSPSFFAGSPTFSSAEVATLLQTRESYIRYEVGKNKARGHFKLRSYQGEPEQKASTTFYINEARDGTEPNVAWEQFYDNRFRKVLRIRVIAPIEAGEELYADYDRYDEEAGVGRKKKKKKADDAPMEEEAVGMEEVVRKRKSANAIEMRCRGSSDWLSFPTQRKAAAHFGISEARLSELLAGRDTKMQEEYEARRVEEQDERVEEQGEPRIQSPATPRHAGAKACEIRLVEDGTWQHFATQGAAAEFYGVARSTMSGIIRGTSTTELAEKFEARQPAASLEEEEETCKVCGETALDKNNTPTDDVLVCEDCEAEVHLRCSSLKTMLSDEELYYCDGCVTKSSSREEDGRTSSVFSSLLGPPHDDSLAPPDAPAPPAAAHVAAVAAPAPLLDFRGGF